jgi:Beta propeller domain
MTRYFIALWLLLASAGHAWVATAQTQMVAEARSVVAPGLWWNEQRNGNGFDVFPIGANLFLVWYTYSESGKAVWYSATAAPQSNGIYRGDWLRHRWQNGRVVESAPVGEALVTVVNPEQMSLRFTLNGQSATWPLTRYRFSAALGEVDRSGLWWELERPGFALSLAEFFDATVAVMYAYDAAGEPAWMLGTRQGKGSRVDMVEYQGACPTCAFRASTEVGRAPLEYESVNGTGVTGGLSARLSSGGLGAEFRVPLALWAFSTTHRPADLQLVPFRDTDNLRRYLAFGATYLRQPPSVILPSPAPPGVFSTFSTTNNQEANVEEPNLLVSDGTTLYGRTVGSGHIAIARLTADSVSTRGLMRSRQPSLNVTAGGLLLHGDLLVNVESTTVRAFSGAGPVWSTGGNWIAGASSIDVFRRDVDGDLQRQFWMDIDGFLLAARRIGDQLIVVSRTARSFGTMFPSGPFLSRDAAYQRLLQLPVSDLLPSALVRDRRETIVQPDKVYLPPQGLEIPQSDFILVTRINLRSFGDRETIAILGTGSAVYVSDNSLYVATSRTERREGAGLPAVSFPFQLTDVHKVSFASGRLQVEGSVTVEGGLDRYGDKAAFRFSEHDGALRVVTTSGSQWGGLGQNRVTIVRPSQERVGTFHTVSVLPNRLRTAPIGKPNEVLFGTRFVGDKLYAVTFKRTDPLYVIDMSQVDDPVVAGQIELPGFSDYLHPLPNRLLLGIGLSAVDAGTSQGDAGFAWYQGVLITLFDVNDINRPRVLQQLEVGKRGSAAEVLNHHHGLSVLPRASGDYDFAMPVTIAEGPPPGSPWMNLPVVDAGLFRLSVNAQAGADARITSLPMLSTRATSTTLTSFGARAVISPQRSIYFSQGRFWQLDHAGNVVSGPF